MLLAVGLERRSDVSSADETASQGREKIVATATILFLTEPPFLPEEPILTILYINVILLPSFFWRCNYGNRETF